MSKILKFRAWDKENQEMMSWQDYSNEIKDAIPHDAGDEWSENCDVMQFTGMKDKNGKEIYEGDLLIQHGNRELEGMIFSVGSIRHYIPLGVASIKGEAWKMQFALGEFGRLSAWTGGNEPFYEVIGNIYENKELVVYSYT